MPSAKLIDEINARLGELFAANPARDIERNVRALVVSGLERLELATREEFDVQAKVLARTREKLGALEARVAELERQLAAEGGTGGGAAV
ncbi:MAG: accessory factor UbiK family protein [Burkholderiales bacterium]|nr:accessory factor UbiK family protein [Burkholderiales bacterium]